MSLLGPAWLGAPLATDSHLLWPQWSKHFFNVPLLPLLLHHHDGNLPKTEPNLVCPLVPGSSTVTYTVLHS